MSFNLITLLVFISSLFGTILLVIRKIPILVELPEAIEESSGNNFYSKLKERIKNTPGLKSFSKDILLQKILSKIRILSLRTENKTFKWLQNLRNKSQEDKFGKDDNYWQKIRKDTEE
jgi:hypothetical protein